MKFLASDFLDEEDIPRPLTLKEKIELFTAWLTVFSIFCMILFGLLRIDLVVYIFGVIFVLCLIVLISVK